MRCNCKLHPYANAVGVCAPCLRDRLLALAAERDQAAASASDGGDDSSCDGSSPRSLPLPARQSRLRRRESERDAAAVGVGARGFGFPRSVSPYVAPRRSDACAPASAPHQPSLLFFRTPQVGPAAGCRADNGPGEESHRKVPRRRRSFLAAIFGGGRRGREDEAGAKAKDPPRRSTSWLSAIVRRKRRPDTAAASLPPAPAPQPDEEPGSPGGGGSSSSWWFPSPSPAKQLHRRRHGAGASGDGISGFAVCLSPLVRPSSASGRRRCQPPDPSSVGDGHRRHASASFGRNTSRKLADMSRFP